MKLINANGTEIKQDLTTFGHAPAGAIALKFNDEISGPEWITDEDRLKELRSEDAPLAYVQTILATIALDPASEFSGQRGELYYFGGDIWLLLPDGTRHATGTGCRAEQAADTIQDAWGKSWGLEWAD